MTQNPTHHVNETDALPLPSFDRESPTVLARVRDKICAALEVSPDQVERLNRIKAGMTNVSYYFELDGVGYVFREAGAGTSKMIDRAQEREISLMMSATGLSDKTVHFDKVTGDRICVFFHGARNADPASDADVEACMAGIRRLHAAHLSCSRDFDLNAEIAKYRRLCHEENDVHLRLLDNYEAVEKRVGKILEWLDETPHERCFCHADSVPDNMIFLPDGSLKLIDWEYAGMCDPLIDPVMFVIYACYDDARIEWTWKTYLQHDPTALEKARLCGLTACSGFLWALWCCYKSTFGIEFGEYADCQYDYAVRYSTKALELFENLPR